MTDKNLTINQGKDFNREETRANEHYLTPAIDIFETEDAVTFVADVPGIEKDNLNIGIDKGILTLDGASKGQIAQGHRLFEEFSLAGYYRQFRIPEMIDAGKAEAELRNGVLTLRLPKAEAAKPKRIDIKTVH